MFEKNVLSKTYRLIILKIIKILSNIRYYADKYLKIVYEVCQVIMKKIYNIFYSSS